MSPIRRTRPGAGRSPLLRPLLPLLALLALTGTGRPAQDPLDAPTSGADPSPVPEGADPARLFPWDPVRLQAGEQVPGRAELEEHHLRFAYRFADEASRRTFLEDPTRYAIRLGGGCARMGPFSGAGRTDIWALHEGGLYVFASEACREGFLKAPESLLPTDDPRPDPGPEPLRAGRDLLELCLSGMGGAERIDSLRGYREVWRDVEEHDGVRYPRGRELWLDLEGGILRRRWYGEWSQRATIPGPRGVPGLPGAPGGTPDPFRERPMALDDSEVYALDASQVQELEREALRRPLQLLRARGRDDFLCWDAGAGQVDGDPTRRLGCWVDGYTVQLDVDRHGLVRAVTARARGEDQAFHRTTTVLEDFDRQLGVTVSRTRRTSVDGGPERVRTPGEVVLIGRDR